MLAGLGLQVFSLAVVLALAADFARTCLKRPHNWNASYAVIRDTRYFRTFIFGKYAYPSARSNFMVKI